MAGRKQHGRGGGRGHRGGRGFSRGGNRGSRGSDGGRGRGRGRGLGHVMMDEIDDDFVVDIVPSRTSGPSFWHMFFMVGALQSQGRIRAAVRHIRAHGATKARERDEGSALIVSRTTRTTATTTTIRGTRLPCAEPVQALARPAGTDISVGAAGGGSPAQT